MISIAGTTSTDNIKNNAILRIAKTILNKVVKIVPMKSIRISD